MFITVYQSLDFRLVQLHHEMLYRQITALTVIKPVPGRLYKRNGRLPIRTPRLEFVRMHRFHSLTDVYAA
jgi:hypothetical protein